VQLVVCPVGSSHENLKRGCHFSIRIHIFFGRSCPENFNTGLYDKISNAIVIAVKKNYNQGSILKLQSRIDFKITIKDRF